MGPAQKLRPTPSKRRTANRRYGRTTFDEVEISAIRELVPRLHVGTPAERAQATAALRQLDFRIRDWVAPANHFDLVQLERRIGDGSIVIEEPRAGRKSRTAVITGDSAEGKVGAVGLTADDAPQRGLTHGTIADASRPRADSSDRSDGGAPEVPTVAPIAVRLTEDACEHAYLWLGLSADAFPPEVRRGQVPDSALRPMRLSLMRTPDVVSVVIGKDGRTPAHGGWRRFYDAHTAAPGDWVVLRQIGEHRYLVSLERPGDDASEHSSQEEPQAAVRPSGADSSNDTTSRAPIERQHTVSAVVKPTREPYPVTRAEQGLVLAMKQHLERMGHDVHRWKILPATERSPLYCDLYDATTNTLIEAKSDSNRPSIRMAIGQLLDYRRFIDRPGLSCAVLLPVRPAQDLLDLLRSQHIAAYWPADAGFAGSGPYATDARPGFSGDG